MIITDIRLENIKNIGFFEAKLTDGLNVIHGPSGVGKSTIIEAIGFTLFDYLAVKKENIVKKGTGKGLVRVGFVCGNESYAVVRSTGSLYYLFNRRSRYKVYENKRDILKWLTKQMGIAETVPLPFFFRHALFFSADGGIRETMLYPSRNKKAVEKLLGLSLYDNIPANIISYKEKLRAKGEAFLNNEKRQAELVDTAVLREAKEAFDKRQIIAARIRRLAVLCEYCKRKISCLDDNIKSAEEKNSSWEISRRNMLEKLSEIEHCKQLLLKYRESYAAFIDFHKKSFQMSSMLSERDSLRQTYSAFKLRLTELAEKEAVLQTFLASEEERSIDTVEAIIRSESDAVIAQLPPDVVSFLEETWDSISMLIGEGLALDKEYKENEEKLSLHLLGGKRWANLKKNFLDACEKRESAIQSQENLLTELTEDAASIGSLESELLIQLANIGTIMSASKGIKGVLAQISKYPSAEHLSLAELLKPSRIQGMLDHQEYIQSKLGQIQEKFGKYFTFELLSSLVEQLGREIALKEGELTELETERRGKQQELEKRKAELQSQIDENHACAENAHKKLLELNNAFYNKSIDWLKIKKREHIVLDVAPKGISLKEHLKNTVFEMQEIRKQIEKLVQEGKKLSESILSAHKAKEDLPRVKQECDKYIKIRERLLELSRIDLESKTIEDALRANSEEILIFTAKRDTFRKRISAFLKAKAKLESIGINGRVSEDSLGKWQEIYKSRRECREKFLFLDGVGNFWDYTRISLKNKAISELGSIASSFWRKIYEESSFSTVRLNEFFIPYFDGVSVPFESFSHEEKLCASTCVQLAVSLLCGFRGPFFIDDGALSNIPGLRERTIRTIKGKFVDAQIILLDSKKHYTTIRENIITI